MTHESNCFLKEGIGSFGTRSRGTFSHLLFFYVLGSGWWADLLKYSGTPAQIFFLKRGRAYLMPKFQSF